MGEGPIYSLSQPLSQVALEGKDASTPICKTSSSRIHPDDDVLWGLQSPFYAYNLHYGSEDSDGVGLPMRESSNGNYTWRENGLSLSLCAI